ncbi:hypothetical protein EJ06DRAFT_559590 [Trichodelitschia bisporula]|uniref:Uncharacterized protein n=1 Tax=Trichodelitschia bisporula TaxID=703511 RepID=A0A6G1HLN3_9PEZI|nr:hypothetical protein EJ06DRAFT_559590 [Trichodelitschia bisporula]
MRFTLLALPALALAAYAPSPAASSADTGTTTLTSTRTVVRVTTEVHTGTPPPVVPASTWPASYGTALPSHFAGNGTRVAPIATGTGVPKAPSPAVYTPGTNGGAAVRVGAWGVGIAALMAGVVLV